MEKMLHPPSPLDPTSCIAKKAKPKTQIEQTKMAPTEKLTI